MYFRMPVIRQAFQVRYHNTTTTFRVPRQIGFATVCVQRISLIMTPAEGNFEITVQFYIFGLS